MRRLIDLDDYRNCYIGKDGEYERWNIDPDVIAEAQSEVIRCYECKYASYEPCGHVKNVYVCNRTPWTRMNGGNLSVCFCSYAERG